VVEGYTDLMALYQFGFKNIVATLGTALTDDHARIMKRYTENVITLFDGDQAGIGASEKAMKHLLAEGLLVKGIYLPEGEDPDSFLKKFGADKLKSAIRSAKDLYIIYLDRMMKSQAINQISDKMNILEKLAPVLNLISRASLKDLYVQETAFRLNLEKEWLSKFLNEFAQRKTTQVSLYQPVKVEVTKNDSNQVKMEPIRLKNANRFERDFINLLLLDEKCLNMAIESGADGLLEGSSVAVLYFKIVQLYRQKPTDFDKLTTVLMSFVEPVNFLTAHLNKPLSELNEAQRMKMLGDYLQRLKELQRRKKIKQFTVRIDSDSSVQDLEQIVNMKKRQLSEKES
jgi:DNA primase